MTFKGKLKQKSSYSKILENFEKKRNNYWSKNKAAFKTNLSVKALDSRRLQMFSGKRGK